MAKGSTAIDGLSGRARTGSARADAGRRWLTNAVGPDRPRDVLELLLADVFEGEVELARGILLHARRDADPAGLGQRFEAGRDIDAIAKDVAVLDDDVADIDADAKLDAVVGRYTGVAPGHLALHLDGAAQCIHHTAELDEQPVAGGLDEATPVLGDFRIEELAAQRSEAFEGAALVGADQPRITRHIGREDRGETTFDAS